MLKPSMQDLMKKVNNRYLLVNLSAQRARDLCAEEEATGKELPDKPVKLALDEISDGEIEYREGPKPEPEKPEDLVAAAAEENEVDLFADEREEQPVDLADDTDTEEGTSDELFR
ncbi:DNA-directed RNA polymerase subunit omega [Butyricicoccus sp.]|uniref:DNA-directed RNA polymerase subunit omega n=1 Tax=Butyricicoccus sp. TaxID=2049021 RepID=UPI003D7DA329